MVEPTPHDTVRGKPIDLGRHDAHAGIDEHQLYGDHQHHGGLAKYVYVFIALCLLTTASFFTYSEWWRENFAPEVGWAFMMAVSVSKAMLVILFFMHVKYEANWKYVLTIPAALMSVFLILMLVPDIGMRGRMASEEVRRHEAVPAADSHHREDHKNEAPAEKGGH